MKRILRGAAIAMSLGLVLAGCTKSEGSKVEGGEPTGSMLVTFVELGSVNCIPCRMMQPIMRDIKTSTRAR